MKLFAKGSHRQQQARSLNYFTLLHKSGWHVAIVLVNLLLALLCGCGPSTAHAQVTTYTDEGTFNAATAKLPFIEDTYEGIVPKGEIVGLLNLTPSQFHSQFDYTWSNSYGIALQGMAVGDSGARQGNLSLNGSAFLAAGGGPNFPITVKIDFRKNGLVNAFGMDLGLRNDNGGDLADINFNTYQRYYHPLTQTLDVQLYRFDEHGNYLPLGDVVHLGSLNNGFLGFVSTVPFATVVITANKGQSFYREYGYEIPDPFQLVFDDVRIGQIPTLPTVTVVGSSPDANVATGQVGDFVLTLSAAAATDLQVAYTVKGSATPGVDYVALKGTAKIKAGKTTKKIKVVPEGDLGGASKKVVKLTLQAGTGYLVGTPDPVKVKILREP